MHEKNWTLDNKLKIAQIDNHLLDISKQAITDEVINWFQQSSIHWMTGLFIMRYHFISKELSKQLLVEEINNHIKPKDPLVAVGTGGGTAFLSLGFPIPVVGAGQIYNGQYLKGVVFFGVGLLGWYLEYLTFDQNEEELGTFDDRIGELGATLILGSIVLSPIDAYYSAKRINSKAKKKLLSTTTSLQYIPHQGMMASYSFGF